MSAFKRITRTEHYRPATQAEIRQAGSDSEYLEDWNEARAYAMSLFGPTVARVRLVIGHNFDDGEETRYCQGAFYGRDRKESYTPVQMDGEWFQRDELHRGWDKDGNELPWIAVIRNHYVYEFETGDDLEAPDFNEYEPWHMEFDFTEEPTVIVLYVKED